jgi:HPt (histidine-containing phosphotransfer) domain-containing protein
MGATIPNSEPLVSCLARDPDLGDIVELYVTEMPERIETLESHFVARDWPGLANFAHQLKGSAGSHGFRQITTRAERLERAAREAHDVSRIAEAYEALVELCRRVR